MKKVVDSLFQRMDPVMAYQWATQVLLAQRDDWSDDMTGGILLALASRFFTHPDWQNILRDEDSFCSTFSLPSLSLFHEQVAGSPLRDLALYCHEQGLADIKHLMVERIPASYFGNGMNHYRWLDEALEANLSVSQVISRLARHTMSSGDMDEVSSGLLWLGLRPDWPFGDLLPVSLKYHGQVALNVLLRHQEFTFNEGFVGALINAHMARFDEAEHYKQMQRLEAMGLPQSFMMLTNRHKRIHLIGDLDI